MKHYEMQLVPGYSQPPTEEDYAMAAGALHQFARSEMLSGGLQPTIKQSVGLGAGTWRDVCERLSELIERPVASWGAKFRCTRCGSGGEPLYTTWSFCPYCGARLVTEEVDE